MSKLPLEKFIPTAFLVFLLLFIILTIIIYTSINSYRIGVQWVNLTQEILTTMDDISLALTKMQLNRRGYIIKEDNKYLADYYNNENEVIKKFAILKGLTSDNPSQNEKVLILDSLAQNSIAGLDSSIMLFDRDRKIVPEIQTPLTMASQEYLDQLLLLAKDLKDSEIKSLNERQEIANINLNDTQVFIIVTSLFVFAVLGLSLFISTGLIKNKNIAEKMLKKSYDEMEDKVDTRTSELKSSNEQLLGEIINRIKTEKSLRESEERFRDMADAAPALIWMSGCDKLCTYFNKGWLEFTGRTFEQELGNGWTEGVYPNDYKRCIETYTTAFDKRVPFEMEYRLRTASGKYRWILERGIPRFEGDEFIGYIGTCLDIHSKKTTERHMRIQYSISKALAESGSVSEALNKVLQNICSELEWEVGMLWKVNNDKLTFGALWSNDTALSKVYLEMYDENYIFEKGVGLPGRVWESQKSVWIQNIEKETNLPRKSGFLKLGWKSGLGFPITENNKVIAVIECFNKNELSPKEDLLEVLENSGSQIGIYLERKKAEEELKKSYDELENRVKERTTELANALNRLLKEMEEKEKVENRLINDISLRKQIETELIESRNSLIEAQGIAKLGNWEWDVKTNNVKWSDEMYNIYELNQEQFKPSYEGFLSLLHPDDIEHVKEQIEKAFQTKSTFDFYERIVTPDGDIKVLRSLGGVRTDTTNNVVKLIGTCHDVTLIRHAEEKIRENEERLSLIMENIKDYAIVTLDESGIISSWNKGAEQIKGYKKDEIVGKHFSVFYTEKDIAANEPAYNLERAKKLGRFENEGWRVRKDGSIFWANITFAPLYTDDGNPKGFVKVTRDETERKKAEEAILDSTHRLQEAQHIAKLGSWELDIKTNKIIWSDEMYRIFDLEMKTEPLTYEQLRKFIHESDREKVDKVSESLLKNPDEMDLEYRIITNDGKLKYLTSEIRVDFDENSNPIRIFGSVQDITEIKMVEEELRKTNVRLIEAQKELVHSEKLAALGRFSSGIAHEIRNPLANISALAQLLSKSNIEDEKLRKHLKYILINTDIANKIIKDLLNFASPEDLVFQDENPSEILNNIVNSFEPRCSQSKIRIARQINIDVNEMSVDKTRLENALMNFISNSVDAMPEGGNLTVNAKNNKTNNEVIIDIIDTGQGISSENLDKIFEPFFTTKESGTGLGLGLAYQTIKLHDGILHISSEPGKGTHVEIILPVKNIINGKDINNRR